MAGFYYAVKVGRQPGIYGNWGDCQAQINGYSGASFRKFDDIEDARRFLGTPVKDKKPSTVQPPSYYSENAYKQTIGQTGAEGPFFYGIANGRQIGVCDNWSTCKAQVSGYPDAKFRRFLSRQEAVDYVNANKHLRTTPPPPQQPQAKKQQATPSQKGTFYAVKFPNGDKSIFNDWNSCKDAISGISNAVYKKFDTIEEAQIFLGTKQLKPTQNNNNNNDKRIIEDFLKRFTRGALEQQRSQGIKNVYTDGSFIEGKGGIGVYFGPNDPNNVSRCLRGAKDSYSPEVHALYHALDIISKLLDDHTINANGIFPKYKIYTDNSAVAQIIMNYANTWNEEDFVNRVEGPMLRKCFTLYNKIKSFYQNNAVLFNNHEFKIEWVRSHEGTYGNEMADRLAKEGAYDSTLYW